MPLNLLPPSEINEAFAQLGDDIVADIISRHTSAGQRASGNFANNLRVESGSRFVYVIDGAGYGYYLEHGRGPTKNGGPRPGKVQQEILKWLKTKGISATPYTRKDGTRQDQAAADKSLAFLIARKIHRDGNRLYQQGGQSGVISGAVTKTRIEAFTDTFKKQYGPLLRNEFLSTFFKQ